LAILLRRFLMTEPTTPPLLDSLGSPGMTAHARHPPAGGTRQRFYTPTAYVTVPAGCASPSGSPAGPARGIRQPRRRVSSQRRTNP
jgi:hypothetical protein